LGVRVTPVTDRPERSFRPSVRLGAQITAVMVDSPADRVGLPLGGIIVGVDGQRIDSPNDLAHVIRASAPNQRIELKYYEGARLFRKEVELAPYVPPQSIPTPARPMMGPPAVSERTLPLRERTNRRSDQRAVPIHPGAAAADRTQTELRPTTSELQDQLTMLRREIQELKQRISDLENR